ncbi:MAG: hypothetical protein HUJ25_15340 [Crocinitomicaceae bacterium]|nr:hypothetical protein [Crocinitomicaceae bacterium]
MKKVFLIPGVVALLFSCGSSDNETNTESTESESLTEETVELSEEGTVLEEENETYTPENIDGIWQIDDYAELFTGTKIYKSQKDVPEDALSYGSYYLTLDTKGGYAHVTGPYEGWSEYVLWRMKDGNDLLGTMSAGCGPACDYNFDFYIMNNGEKIGDGNRLIPRMEIEDFGASLMPQILEEFEAIEYKEDYQFYYNFPQQGTSMEVDIIVGADEVRIPIILLSWDKEKFSVEKKYTELYERI